MHMIKKFKRSVISSLVLFSSVVTANMALPSQARADDYGAELRIKNLSPSEKDLLLRWQIMKDPKNILGPHMDNVNAWVKVFKKNPVEFIKENKEYFPDPKDPKNKKYFPGLDPKETLPIMEQLDPLVARADKIKTELAKIREVSDVSWRTASSAGGQLEGWIMFGSFANLKLVEKDIAIHEKNKAAAVDGLKRFTLGIDDITTQTNQILLPMLIKMTEVAKAEPQSKEAKRIKRALRKLDSEWFAALPIFQGQGLLAVRPLFITQKEKPTLTTDESDRTTR